MSNWNAFQKKYRQAPQSIKDLIDSDATLRFLHQIVDTESLERADRHELIILISDALLNIIETAEIERAPILQKFNPSEREILSREIIAFVKSQAPRAPTNAHMTERSKEDTTEPKATPMPTQRPEPKGNGGALPERYLRPLTETPRYEED